MVNVYLQEIYIQRHGGVVRMTCEQWMWMMKMNRCHWQCFHQLSGVAEDGSTFVCHCQLCEMNDALVLCSQSVGQFKKSSIVGGMTGATSVCPRKSSLSRVRLCTGVSGCGSGC